MRTLIPFLTCVLLTVFSLAAPCFAKYSGGTGQSTDPYLISTPEDMNSIGANPGDWDKNFLLTNDIDMADFTYTTALIAPDTNSSSIGFQGTKFTGLFDGAGFKVTNLTVDTANVDNDFLGLFGYTDSAGTVKNLGIEDVNITGGDDSGSLGSLVGRNYGTISECFSTSQVTGGDKSDHLGGLAGSNYGTISNCFSTGQVTGGYDSRSLGGLVGRNQSTISNCFSTASVAGDVRLGGLVATNYNGTIRNCYATGSVTGGNFFANCIGGLVGDNYSSTISNCYSTGSVTGGGFRGGLVGNNHRGIISNCYATGSVNSWKKFGGVCGHNWGGIVDNCFWDINTSGLTHSDGGTGKTTEQMQTMSTFTNAGWDFATPVWKICETADYPRLAWQKIQAPILNPEPDITTGTENTITWQDVNEAVEYYAICCNDPNLEEVIMDTGWIDTNEVTFAGLDTGSTYYYAVKARRNCVMESDFSNVESSMQGTLGNAVDVMLDPNSLKNANMANALTNKIDEVLAMIDAGNYQAALKKLENDILRKTDGCANSGQPDKNDWIETCQQQAQIYPLIMETIEYVETLIE
ncbi:MAG: GLUG motif-containing protein [Planctomycetota bacterium]|jgi:hypothetical protein